MRSAIAHGVSHLIGDIAVGKLADLVMWKPSNFGVRPEQVIKGGVIAWAQMGDANAVSSSFRSSQGVSLISIQQSIPTVQPVIGRPMWGCQPAVAALNSVLFVSALSLSSGQSRNFAST